MQKILRKLLCGPSWLIFILMGVFFVLFGALSFNLVFLLKANINLYLDYGIMVIDDGALRQLVELLVYGYLSLFFYLCFKTSEHILVERVSAAGHARVAEEVEVPRDA